MYNGINHLAFITRDLDTTIRFYRDLLGFPLFAGVGDARFKHYFFEVTPRDSIAFFAYDEATPMDIKPHGSPTRAPLGFDHVSVGVETKAELFTLMDKLVAQGIEVSGPVDHGFIWSIYFYDPNNIPLEVSWQNMDFIDPPALADEAPSTVALEGSQPQDGHWAPVTHPTPEEQWQAYPGAGYEIRTVALAQNRAKLIEDPEPTGN